MKFKFSPILLVFLPLSLSAQQVLKDIAPGGYNGVSSNAFLTVANNTLFFTAISPDGGKELWKTDGTTAGTVQVMDIRPGTQDSNPDLLTAVENKIFFTADDGSHGTELWVSDGSTAGTRLVADNCPGTPASLIMDMHPFGSTLLFKCNPWTGTGRELWRTDGTSAGTFMVKDINPGSDGSDPTFFQQMNGSMYFGAESAPLGFELWKSDGTEGGTSLVKDIFQGTAYGNPAGKMAQLGNRLLFFAKELATGTELWSSDGTFAGTSMVSDINPGSANTYTLGSNMAVMNGYLYFSANGPGLIGQSLWKTDGTAGGTVLVSSEVEPIESNFDQNNFTVFNNKLFFRGRTQALGEELWVTDGTTAGTHVVKDIYLGTGSSSGFSSFLPTPMGNHLYFRANDNIFGTEIWRTDGTESGTAMVADLYPGQMGVNPNNLIAWNNALYFSGSHPNMGTEIWKYVPEITESKKAESAPSITISPNPASAGLQIFAELVPEEVVICNALGRQIKMKTNKVSGGQYQLDTSTLPPGIYFLCLNEGNKRFEIIR